MLEKVSDLGYKLSRKVSGEHQCSGQLKGFVKLFPLTNKDKNYTEIFLLKMVRYVKKNVEQEAKLKDCILLRTVYSIKILKFLAEFLKDFLKELVPPDENNHFFLTAEQLRKLLAGEGINENITCVFVDEKNSLEYSKLATLWNQINYNRRSRPAKTIMDSIDALWREGIIPYKIDYPLPLGDTRGSAPKIKDLGVYVKKDTYNPVSDIKTNTKKLKNSFNNMILYAKLYDEMGRNSTEDEELLSKFFDDDRLKKDFFEKINSNYFMEEFKKEFNITLNYFMKMEDKVKALKVMNTLINLSEDKVSDDYKGTKNLCDSYTKELSHKIWSKSKKGKQLKRLCQEGGRSKQRKSTLKRKKSKRRTLKKNKTRRRKR